MTRPIYYRVEKMLTDLLKSDGIIHVNGRKITTTLELENELKKLKEEVKDGR
jgi:hypothetical protein